MGCGKLIPLPASSQFAPARRENILHPLGLAAVGERDDEPARRSKDVLWVYGRPCLISDLDA
jgi:hypothetical protein